MGDRMQLQIPRFGRPVVQHQDGAVPAGKEMLQRKDLPAIAKRVLRQKTQLGQAVQDHARRIGPFDQLKDAAYRFAQFDLAWMEEGLFVIGAEFVFGHHFEDIDPVEGETMRLRDCPQLVLGFGQGDVKPVIAGAAPFQQEPERQGRLARARRSLDKIKPRWGQAAPQDCVKPGCSCQ